MLRRPCMLCADGSGLAGVVFATDDLAADSARLRARDRTWRSVGRRAASGPTVRWCVGVRHGCPRPTRSWGSCSSSNTTRPRPSGAPEDRAARAAAGMPGLGRVRLLRVELGVADVARASMRLLREFGSSFGRHWPAAARATRRSGVRLCGSGRREMARHATRPNGRDERRRARQPRSADVLGCRWEIVPSWLPPSARQISVAVRAGQSAGAARPARWRSYQAPVGSVSGDLDIGRLVDHPEDRARARGSLESFEPWRDYQPPRTRRATPSRSRPGAWFRRGNAALGQPSSAQNRPARAAGPPAGRR